MYVADRPIKRHRILKSLKVASVLLLIAIVAVGWLIWKDATKATTVDSSNNSAIVSKISDSEEPTKTFDEPFFTIDLPEDWVIINRNDNPRSPMFVEWQAGKDPGDRWIKLYYDNIPADTALNRLLPLSVINSRIVPGVLSENCSTFTGQDQKDKPTAQKVEIMASKWQNISFFCDLGRATRNVTGTGAEEVRYALPINGEEKGKHTYFFVYTDHNSRPNYKIFTDALRSFIAK